MDLVWGEGDDTDIAERSRFCRRRGRDPINLGSVDSPPPASGSNLAKPSLFKHVVLTKFQKSDLKFGALLPIPGLYVLNDDEVVYGVIMQGLLPCECRNSRKYQVVVFIPDVADYSNCRYAGCGHRLSTRV